MKFSSKSEANQSQLAQLSSTLAAARSARLTLLVYNLNNLFKYRSLTHPLNYRSRRISWWCSFLLSGCWVEGGQFVAQRGDRV